MTDAIDRKYAQLASLRQPILEDPLNENTGNWLVLADFLQDEMGWEDEANFIRSQAGVNSLKVFDQAVYSMVIENAHLNNICRDRYRTKDYSLGSRVWNDPGDEEYLIDFGFRRGLVSKITLSLDTFIDHWNTLFDRHPITEVEITTDPTIYRERDRGSLVGYPVVVRDYCWNRQMDLERKPNLVPTWIFRHMCYDKDNLVFISTLVFPGDPGPGSAKRALGRACLAAARHEFGLPPLKEKK